MKTKYYLFLFFLFFSFNTPNLFSQKKLILRPDGDTGKDAMVWNGNSFDDYANRNFGDNERLYAHAWTNSGIPDVTRSLLDFDLSQIPAGATIISAKLSLHFYTDLDAFFGEHHGENAGKVSQVTSAWEEGTVTWNTQPTYTTANQVSFSKVVGSNDLVNIDITTLVEAMLVNPANNHGLMFQLATESQYRALAFASSDYHEAGQRPKLEIVYTQALSELTLQPDASAGKDAMVWNGNSFDDYANRNYGDNERLYAHSWTNSGIRDVSRSLLDFDLSQLPSDAIIISAKLSLYFYTDLDAFFGEHHGSNSGKVNRVTSAWEEGTVTWNTQPTYTFANQVSFSSVQDKDDLVDVDITALIKDILNNPANGHGIMYQLATESPYRALAFASSDFSDATKHPKLVIQYASAGEICPDEIGLHDTNANGVYSAKHSIESDVVINMEENTTLLAEIVSLKAGFHVMPLMGSTFLAQSESCGVSNELRERPQFNFIQPQTGTVKILNSAPTLSLSPNPFVGETILNFELPKSSNVTVQVFSISGSLISTLIDNREFSSGTHSISYNNQIDYKGMLFFVLQTEKGRIVSKGIQHGN